MKEKIEIRLNELKKEFEETQKYREELLQKLDKTSEILLKIDAAAYELNKLYNQITGKDFDFKSQSG